MSMKNNVVSPAGVILLCVASMMCLQTGYSQSFKEEQLKFPRVKIAFDEKDRLVDSVLKRSRIERTSLQIFLRALKNEKMLEVWGKNKRDERYRLLSAYPFCETSGDLGPKRMEGDRQIPEGVYHINHFNPVSNFYLSLGINYPNESDAILGVQGKLGGEIYLHGDCVTIGCIPITDDAIKEVYLFAAESRNNGQQHIPVHIFPTRLDAEGLAALRRYLPNDTALHRFWENLSSVFRSFEQTQSLKTITIDSRGRYRVQ